jgi:C_GCAxxG_C_C family probable redox protein
VNQQQAIQHARELFQSEYNCAESVLMAIAQSQGIGTEWIPRLATGFGGGIARTGQVCGALSGAIIGMGLVLGRDNPEVKADDFYAAVQKLLADFEASHGTTQCRALTHLDFMTPEGRANYRTSDAAARCLEYVGEAASQALTLLDASDE